MGKYAKAIVAVLTAALIALKEALPLDATQSAWVSVILATLGSIAVYAIPNGPTPAPYEFRERGGV